MLRTAHRPFRARSAAPWLLAALLVGAAACSRTAPETPGVIDREVFIETWVDLRLAALRAPGRRISASERERVLREHEVTEEELLAFAEVHGSDIELMKEVWDAVERRFEELRPKRDTSMPG